MINIENDKVDKFMYFKNVISYDACQSVLNNKQSASKAKKSITFKKKMQIFHFISRLLNAL